MKHSNDRTFATARRSDAQDIELVQEGVYAENLLKIGQQLQLLNEERKLPKTAQKIMLTWKSESAGNGSGVSWSTADNKDSDSGLNALGCLTLSSESRRVEGSGSTGTPNKERLLSTSSLETLRPESDASSFSSDSLSCISDKELSDDNSRSASSMWKISGKFSVR